MNHTFGIRSCCYVIYTFGATKIRGFSEKNDGNFISYFSITISKILILDTLSIENYPFHMATGYHKN